MLVFTRYITDPACDIINLAASSQVEPQTLCESHYKQPNWSSELVEVMHSPPLIHPMHLFQCTRSIYIYIFFLFLFFLQNLSILIQFLSHISRASGICFSFGSIQKFFLNDNSFMQFVKALFFPGN